MPQITQIKSNQAKEKRGDFPKTFFPDQARGTHQKKKKGLSLPLLQGSPLTGPWTSFSHFLFFFLFFAFQLFPIVVVVVAFTAITREFRSDSNFDLDLRFSFRFQFPLGVRVVLSLLITPPTAAGCCLCCCCCYCRCCSLACSFSHGCRTFCFFCFFVLVVHSARCNYLVYALSFSFFWVLYVLSVRSPPHTATLFSHSIIILFFLLFY